MHNIFVYGSLMSGMGNHALLEDYTPRKAFTHLSIFQMRAYASFPAVYRKTDGTGVGIAGEMYRVNDETLERLDHLEGHPTWYKRQLHWFDVMNDAGDEFEFTQGQLYVMQGEARGPVVEAHKANVDIDTTLLRYACWRRHLAPKHWPNERLDAWPKEVWNVS